MADKERLVRVRVLRPYPRGERTFQPGEIHEFPAHVATSMAHATPPFGERVSAADAAQAADAVTKSSGSTASR